MVRFLHTSDWQLGMGRYFLSPEAQARFTGARVDAIRTICRIAVERGCQFIVVAGDVFESNHLDRQVAVRALEAMRASTVPIYLLPGNHDPLDASSIYRSPTFVTNCPPNVVVLDGPIVEAVAGVDLVPAPWITKRPTADPLTAAYTLDANPSRLRIVVGHGSMDYMPRGEKDPPPISLSAVEQLIERGAAHYVALGDRHSRTAVGASGRIHYSSAPEPTDFDETDPGHALVVDLRPGAVDVQTVDVGTWRFERRAFQLAGESTVNVLREWLAAMSQKDRTVVRVALQGTLTLDCRAALEEALAQATDAFASCELDGNIDDLLVLDEDEAFDSLRLAGFAATTLEELLATVRADSDSAATARDALVLLYRLARDAA
jgi:DNA repair exonuclease SbcCD nuclease subunit